MKIQNKISKIFLGILVPAICILVSTLNWWGCKTEEITGINNPPVTNSNLLGGRVILGDYLYDTIPLNNVKVDVVNGPTLYTDSYGSYWLNNISYGKHILKYSKEGYSSTFIQLDTINFRIGIPSVYLSKINTPVSIGIDGGMIQQNRMTLIIPPGALTKTTSISLATTPISTSLKTDLVPIDMFNIYPEGISFNKPITFIYAKPNLYRGSDSIPAKTFLIDFNNYIWSESNAQIVSTNDSVEITFSSQTDNSSFTIPTIGLGFIGYIEVSTTGTWSAPMGFFPFQTIPTSGCAGAAGNGTIAGSSTSLTIGYSGAAGLSYVVSLSLGVTGSYSTAVTFNSVTVPTCKCINFNRVIEKGFSTLPVSVRHCITIPFHSTACTAWSTFTIKKDEFKGNETSHIISDNPIPECHNQGGN